MPRVKRFFPVSQDINGDPESWLLTDMFGDRALRVWLEILSSTDKLENKWRLSQGWLSSFARRVRLSKGTVVKVMEFLLVKRWLIIVDAYDPIGIKLKELLLTEWPTDSESLQEFSRMVHGSLADGPRIIGGWSTDDPLTNDKPFTDHRGLVLGTRNYKDYHRTRVPKGEQHDSDDGSLRTEPNRTEPNKEEKEKDRKKIAPSVLATKAAQFLADRVVTNHPAGTKPTDGQLQEWARVADLINQRDHHSFDEITALIDWATSDTFWSRNILSMQKLREKWTTLSAQKPRQSQKRDWRYAG